DEDDRGQGLLDDGDEGALGHRARRRRRGRQAVALRGRVELEVESGAETESEDQADEHQDRGAQVVAPRTNPAHGVGVQLSGLRHVGRLVRRVAFTAGRLHRVWELSIRGFLMFQVSAEERGPVTWPSNPGVSLVGDDYTRAPRAGFRSPAAIGAARAASAARLHLGVVKAGARLPRMPSGRTAYFLSDVHLGAESRQREAGRERL